MFYPVTETTPNFFTMPDLGMSCAADSVYEALDYFADHMPDYIEETFRKKGKPIPTPSTLKDNDAVLVVPLKLEARILLWNLLKEKYMTTSELSRLMGISRQQAQFLVDGTRPVSLDMYYEAIKALGYYLSFELNQFK